MSATATDFPCTSDYMNAGICMFSPSLPSWHPVIIFVELDRGINHSSLSTPLPPPHRRANGSDGGLTGQQRHLQLENRKFELLGNVHILRGAVMNGEWKIQSFSLSTMWVASEIVVLTFLRLLGGGFLITMRKRSWGGNLKVLPGRTWARTETKTGSRPTRNIVEQRGCPQTQPSAVWQQETVSAQQEAAYKSSSVRACLRACACPYAWDINPPSKVRTSL